MYSDKISSRNAKPPKSFAIPLRWSVVAGLVVLASVPLAAEDLSSRYESVLEFGPVGYWPADEGQGSVLHDRSGHENHGQLFNLSWQEELLEFTSGFHWAEIPSRPEYRSASISLGGWFFTRRDDYLGGSDLQGPHRHAADNHHTHGVSLINNAYGNRGGWVRWDGADRLQEGVGLRLRAPGANRNVGGALLDVVHGNRADVLDSAFDGLRMVRGQWQHVLYTFHDGTGSLYLDGRMVQSKDGVSLSAANRPFVVGNDMSWWMLYPTGSQSLDGSIRDLVIFDRALSAQEVARLCEATRPDVWPKMHDADAIVIDGTFLSLDDLLDATVADRRRALEMWDDRSVQRIRTLPDSMIRILKSALDDWQTRRVAASLLSKLDRDEARAVLQAAIPDLFLGTLRDDAKPPQHRAASALALAAIGSDAKATVPVLVQMLQEILDRQGSDLPRVEDLVRNSLMRALLDIAPQDARVRHVLGQAFAKPILDSLDLSQAYLADVRPLVAEGRYMDALDIYRTLPLRQHGDFFLSQGDRHRDLRQGTGRDYSSVVQHDGCTYTVGSGRAWDAAEKISAEDYQETIAALPVEFREAAENWIHADSPNLYRVRIHKTDPQGKTQSVILEGNWFVFEGSDTKLLGWTIDVDQRGHIHLIGGLHNQPHPGLYVPGSWEKMGLSRNRNDDRFPSVMYWVSSRPGDLSSLEFVGQRNNPRNLPSPGMNYMNFVRDPDNVMYLYGRIGAQGIQSWGFYRYDADRRRWSPVGADANAVFQATQDAWGEIFLRRGGILWEPRPFVPAETVFVWAWQPHFYNYIRGWGVRFDRSGRMHVRVPIRGLGTNARIRDAQVYAWSDDRGQTFFRADGTPLKLPLTVNPAPGHHADLDYHFTRHWLDLWHSLLRHAGYAEAVRP